MSVTCWVRDKELKAFVKKVCGVETLTEQHRLVSFKMNGEGDLFLHFERHATKKTRPKVKANKRSKRRAR